MSKQRKFKKIENLESVTVKCNTYKHIRKHSDDKIDDNCLLLIHLMYSEGNGSENHCKKFCESAGIDINTEFECVEEYKTLANVNTVFDICEASYGNCFRRDLGKLYYSKISRMLDMFPKCIQVSSPHNIQRRVERIFWWHNYYNKSIDEMVNQDNDYYNNISPTIHPWHIHAIDIDTDLLCECVCELFGKSYSEIFEDIETA